MSFYDPSSIDALPASLPIFPLSGVLLLPRGMLPLNIFEPRYLSMVEDALAADRMIGMIQPKHDIPGEHEPPLYSTACAGRITHFEETDDGRFLITLKGVCRFKVAEEISSLRGYRRAQADWSDFKHDIEEDADGAVDRDALFHSLRAFFRAQGIEASWEALQETADERLITSLSMICPFEPREKQALLEAPDLKERAKVLIALIEMAALDTGGNNGEDKAKQ